MNDEHGCSPDLQSLRGKSIYQSAKEQSRKPEPQPLITEVGQQDAEWGTINWRKTGAEIGHWCPQQWGVHSSLSK